MSAKSTGGEKAEAAAQLTREEEAEAAEQVTKAEAAVKLAKDDDEPDATGSKCTG